MLIVILSLTALLFFVWPIPHTVSIREVSLLSVFLLSIIFIFKNKVSSATVFIHTYPIAFYLFFTAWIIFIGAFVSTDTYWALKELKSQWLWATLAIMHGIFMGVIIKDNAKLIPFTMMFFFFALLIHIILINADGFINIILNNHLDKLTYATRLTGGLTIGPIDASVLCDFFLIIVIAEWIYRKMHNKKMIPVHGNVLSFALIISLTGSFFCGLRNILELTIIAIFVFVLLFNYYRQKRTIVTVFAMMVFLIIVFFLYKTDSRWGEISNSISLAKVTAYDWNVEYKHATIEPVAGQIVNASNYLRFEKYETSLNMIKSNYFGVGYGRNAFGHSLKKDYEKAAGLNADSSFFDLFIGTGIVGGLLWLCFYVSLIYTAFMSFKNNRGFTACLLLLLLVTFGTRMMIDSIFRDHLMQQFLFMAAFFLIVENAGSTKITNT